MAKYTAQIGSSVCGRVVDQLFAFFHTHTGERKSSSSVGGNRKLEPREREGPVESLEKVGEL